MTVPFHARLISTLGLVPVAASLMVILLGCLSLAGWLLDLAALRSIFSGWPSMVPNTALGLILAGGSLWLLRDAPPPRLRRIAQIGAALVVLLALLTLSEYVFGWDLGIDRWLFAGKLVADGQPFPGRIASGSVVSFLLMGGALWLIDLETKRGWRPAQPLALTAFMLALMVLLCYGYGAIPLPSASPFPGMACHTAVAFLALAVGIFCARPEQGMMAVVINNSAGGFMVRRLLIAAIIVPAILGWIRMVGQRAGYYDAEFGTSILVATSIIVFLIVVWRNAELLHATDTKRKLAEETLRHVNTDLEQRVTERTAELAAANAELQREMSERERAKEEREQLLAREQAARVQAEQAAEIIRRLQAVTDSVLANLALDDLLHEMLGRICELLKVDATVILLLAEHGRELTMCAAAGLEDEMTANVQIPLGQGIIGQIAATRAPLVVDDLTEVEVLSPVLREKMRSLIGVPLLIEGRVIGVIHADTAEFRHFTEDDVRLLQLVADRVALAIEQSRLYEAEQRARRQAETSNRMKDEFLATVSHELRSPLNAILGWVKLLREGQLEAEAAGRALETIERSARSQNRIINDLLDVSRIITGHLQLNVRPIKPARFVEAAIETVRPAAEAKKIRLQTVLDAHAGPISGDSDRLQQIVWNLVSNAIKFTPKGGRVQVRLERVHSHIEVIVSDTGAGISSEFLPFVFDRFRQADSSSTRRHSGLGLGLAIVRHLTELHGGTIHVTSPGEGQGATFVVKLPLMVSHSRSLNGARTHPAVEEQTAMDCPPQLDGLRALVVDDDPDAREVVATILTQCEAEVRTAASADEALTILAEWQPNVLISDIEMPETNGYALIQKIRALEPEQGGRIPAVALTAYTRIEDRLHALAAGFQMHVPKPVDPAELVTIVASLAGRLGQRGAGV